jgi:hypothetical protein
MDLRPKAREWLSTECSKAARPCPFQFRLHQRDPEHFAFHDNFSVASDFVAFLTIGTILSCFLDL